MMGAVERGIGGMLSCNVAIYAKNFVFLLVFGYIAIQCAPVGLFSGLINFLLNPWVWVGCAIIIGLNVLTTVFRTAIDCLLEQ